MREETDFIGKVYLPDKALYGIHAKRASENFENRGRFSEVWYRAVGMIKQACYITTIDFINAAKQKFPEKPLPKGCEDVMLFEKLSATASEISKGKYYDHFIVPAIQGGAGTAINMNINEIIANATLVKNDHKPGDYYAIDPFVHCNIFQSTNDVIPTALKVAVMQQLEYLESMINQLREKTEEKETKHRSDLRVAYTQMQQALPSSYGALFSSWSDALSRDWWRVSKCFERIKVTNLGGGATGSGMSIPRFFIMEVTTNLRKIADVPVTRSENPPDTTQNLDSFVEVHAILKSHAVNLEKMCSDLRLLSSDLIQNKELTIPAVQTGSSIMPGKVNPVIPEFVISCAHKVYSNDSLITGLCAQGTLDLNPYLPAIGDAILDSLHLLIQADKVLTDRLFGALEVRNNVAVEKLMYSPAITTALLPLLGYEKASLLAGEMKKKGVDVYRANQNLKLLEEKRLQSVLLPENLLKLGFSLKDMPDSNH